MRSRVGLISHHTMLYEALSPRENVAFAARLHGVRDASRVDESLSRMSMLVDNDYPSSSTTWTVSARNNGAQATNWSIQAYAICAP